jgi:hypothetical protein
MGDDGQAMTVVAQGLANHPQDVHLLKEFAALQQISTKPHLKIV